MRFMITDPGLESPFRFLSPETALTVGILSLLFGASLLSISAVDLNMNDRQKMLLAFSLVLSAYFFVEKWIWLRDLYMILSLLIAILLPVSFVILAVQNLMVFEP